jgi:hypothetical protein
MSFGGHVFDMINRAKQNEAARKKRRERYDRVKDVHLNSIKHEKILPPPKKQLTKDELDEIKKDLKLKLKKQRAIRITKIFIVSTAIVLFIYFLFIKIVY